MATELKVNMDQNMRSKVGIRVRNPSFYHTQHIGDLALLPTLENGQRVNPSFLLRVQRKRGREIETGRDRETEREREREKIGERNREREWERGRERRREREREIEQE